MSKNPSYARFEYAYNDLKDCLEHITDEGTLLSKSEREFRLKLVEICNKITLDYQDSLMPFDDEKTDDDICPICGDNSGYCIHRDD